jgi:para-nitrobenzyl esterase
MAEYFGVLLAGVAIVGVASAQSTDAEAPIVRVETGQLRGVEADGVVSFKGIPYARPPIWNLRWRAPQTAQH